MTFGERLSFCLFSVFQLTIHLLQGLEGLVGKIVFDLAGILACSLVVDAKKVKETVQDLMPFIDLGRDGKAGRSQAQHLLLTDGDIAFVFELLESDGNAGLGEIHGSRDVDGMDVQISFFLQHQDSFEIVFCGFVCIGVSHTVGSFLQVIIVKHI